MFGSNILDVMIGIIFVYILLSLISTSIHEGVASFLNKRGYNLFDGIKNLLNDPQFTGLAQQLYTHGLVNGISQDAANPQKPNRLPSYMASNTFAMALLDILGSRGVGKSWPDVIQQRQKELTAAQAAAAGNPGDVKLQKAVQEAQTVFDAAQANAAKAMTAEQAHMVAEKAAQKVTGLTDLKNIQEASAKLASALTAGRALAAAHPDPLGNIQKAVESLPEGHTKESLLVLVEKTKREALVITNQMLTVEQQLGKLQENIESWFNDTMDRVTGWYKRWTQKILLGIIILIVIFANVDTIMLAKRLTRDGALRASVVAAVDKAGHTNLSNPEENEKAQQALLTQAAKLQLPLGWFPAADDPAHTEQVPTDVGGWILKVFGLLLSVFAASLGAPFWFDTLSKFVNLRGAGTPPGETKKSAPQPITTQLPA